MLAKARSIHPQLIAWRREFHHQPELGFHEVLTAARVADILRSLGYAVRTEVGRTGVVGEWGQGRPVVAIRADMDALPILEANTFEHASHTPGMMHACGHDAHTAMALGAAALLKQESFAGRVRLIHQPSEEVGDSEGISGAPRMIADGALEDVDMIIALHVDPATPVGQISISDGPISGGVDSFFATISGVGGHGAAPHQTVDPIYLAGHIILALHGIVSRRLDPFAPAVISLGSIHAGEAENVIPDHVEISGTIRFLEKSVRQQIHAEVERALSIARTLGGDYTLDLELGVPPMVNDAQVTQRIQQAAVDLLGSGNVLPARDDLGAEDFGCFTELVPGAMFTLGCRIEGDERRLHSPRFDIDERCLPVGAALLAETALRFLQERS